MLLATRCGHARAGPVSLPFSTVPPAIHGRSIGTTALDSGTGRCDGGDLRWWSIRATSLTCFACKSNLAPAVYGLTKC